MRLGPETSSFTGSVESRVNWGLVEGKVLDKTVDTSIIPESQRPIVLLLLPVLLHITSYYYILLLLLRIWKVVFVQPHLLELQLDFQNARSTRRPQHQKLSDAADGTVFHPLFLLVFGDLLFGLNQKVAQQYDLPVRFLEIMMITTWMIIPLGVGWAVQPREKTYVNTCIIPPRKVRTQAGFHVGSVVRSQEEVLFFWWWGCCESIRHDLFGTVETDVLFFCSFVF